MLKDASLFEKLLSLLLNTIDTSFVSAFVSDIRVSTVYDVLVSVTISISSGSSVLAFDPPSSASSRSDFIKK